MAENAPFYSKICEGFAGTSLFKITTSFPLLTSRRPFLQTRISPNNTSHFTNLFWSTDRSNRSPWGEHTKEREYISDGNDLVSLHNDFFLTLESQIHSFRNLFFEINPPILSIYSMDYMYSQNTNTTYMKEESRRPSIVLQTTHSITPMVRARSPNYTVLKNIEYRKKKMGHYSNTNFAILSFIRCVP